MTVLDRADNLAVSSSDIKVSPVISNKDHSSERELRVMKQRARKCTADRTPTFREVL